MKAAIRLLEKIQRHRMRKFLGRDHFEMAVTNPLPPLVGAVLLIALIAWLKNPAHYIGDFFYWLIHILRMPAIFKIDSLSNPMLYEGLSFLVYALVAGALVIDLIRFLYNNLFCLIAFTDDHVYIYRDFFILRQIRSWNIKSHRLSFSLKTGPGREFLGLERWVIHIPGEKAIVTPFLWRMRRKNFQSLLNL